ncbi:ptzF [Candidatus Endolissoclinum faulkneri L2]|uniref:PtzF n=1 Tax=Candidatus Endolissoclinum faulkneri L2 TaxID=1193729 RepID=K7YMK5_9PROT|nr:non-ribosomal peptide synthetase [Candidatus Endolissoclinum faulkneri]AFX98752.1 ptzF [Candidatus Endolissoclinum faulkneri L2]
MGHVAIIGMAFRLPGATDEDSLWSLLAKRKTALQPVPADRWDREKFHDKSYSKINHTVMDRGGFLDNVDKFDAAFFGISSREARAMDPQQRMLLEETWHCLENAGVRPSDLENRKVGVFTGVMANDYQQNATAPGQAIGVFSALGTYGALLANRLSHTFKWTGPSFTVDAACASSLVALHQACQALSGGECDYAIVAAANALIHPWRSISFSQAHMLSPDGECRTFDARANGYVQGEGVVVMLLTRRVQVRLDGLRERAAILGTAVNHVGPSRSVTAPSVSSQVSIIEAAIADAGIDKDSIGYVEAHGTGTPLGDPIEAAALSAVFSNASQNKIAIGSIKSNFGHLEAAAGLAGLTKLVLMLERNMLLPTALLNEINPLIDMDGGRVLPVKTLMPWPNDRPRAGVSSFGFGGANSHAILEGPTSELVIDCKTFCKKSSMTYLLSASSKEALDRLKNAHLSLALSEKKLELNDVSQTLTQRRQTLPIRFAAVVKDWDDVIRSLTKPTMKHQTGRWMLRLGDVNKVLDGAVWDQLIKALPDLADRGEEAVESARLRNATRRASRRLLQLARLHALASFILDNAIIPDVLYGEGIGRWVSLTTAGVIDLSDAVILTGAGRIPEIKLRRPQIAVYDSVMQTVIPPRRVDANYISKLSINLDFDLSNLLDQSVRLIKTNHTFAGFLDSWRESFITLGIGEPESWSSLPADSLASKVLFLALGTARRQTCQRWNIPEPGVVIKGKTNEVINLVALGALSPADAVLLLDTSATVDLADRINLNPLTPEVARRHLPILAKEWSKISEIKNPRAWLQGQNEGSYQPNSLGIDRTIDVGSLTPSAEGKSTLLRFDNDFPNALQEIMVERWTAGYDVNWSKFSQPHHITNLPSYPFEKTRHWISMPESNLISQAPESATCLTSTPIYDLEWKKIASGSLLPNHPIIFLSSSEHFNDSLPESIQIFRGEVTDRSISERLLAVPLDESEQRTIIVAWAWESNNLSVENVADNLVIPILRLVADLSNASGKVKIVLLGQDMADKNEDPLLEPGFAAAFAAAMSVAAENRYKLEITGILIKNNVAEIIKVLGLSERSSFNLIAVRDNELWSRHITASWNQEISNNQQEIKNDQLDAKAWLLIGGYGGIGESLIRYLSKRSQNKLKLAVIGRRSLEEVKEINASLTNEDISTFYTSADVTETTSLAAAVADLEMKVGRIGTIVHAEMLLADHAATNMSDQEFQVAFTPKALGFANVSAVFAERGVNRPKRIVFGSILGLIGNAGQANYTAGTAHQMAQALLAIRENWDVKHISWGYWAEIGRVANALHRSRVAKIGLEPMSTMDGLRAMDQVLSNDSRAVVVAKLSPKLFSKLSAPEKSLKDLLTEGLKAIDDLAMLRISAAFSAIGWLESSDSGRSSIAKGQEQLFDTLSGFLAMRGWNAIDRETATTRAISLAANIRQNNTSLSGIVNLLEAATEGTVAVLTGEIPGTNVIFPGGDMTLVEGYYHGNPLADAANKLVAEKVAKLVVDGLSSGKMIRILEVGAGTGGTTSAILKALDLIINTENIEYVFSDLSPAFLRRAKAKFGIGRNWFTTARFDFNDDPVNFSTLGIFNIVIAANAIHVTEKIDLVLDRLVKRIAPGGALILNELMRPLEHMTVIFGLLPGWWLAQDVRAGAGPLLAADQWRSALNSRFTDISIDGPSDDHGLIQGVLVASYVNKHINKQPVVASVSTANLNVIYNLIAKCLEVEPERLDPDAMLSDLGLDSILTFDLTERIEKETGIAFDPATITDLATPAALAAEVINRQSELDNYKLTTTKSLLEPSSVTRQTKVSCTAANSSELLQDDAIAIIGAAGIFPGANSLAALEQRIIDGNPSLGPIPEGRWSEADIALAKAEDLRYLRGGFLNQGENFDAARFGISDREAQVIDPRQRLLLEQSLAALADAGRPDMNGYRESFGVFVGTGGGDYVQKLMTAGHPVQPQSLGALMPSSSAARIAHIFGFEGPAMAIDLACASGLAALHLAVNALLRGECYAAIVGAASIQATPGFAVQINRAGLASRSGNPLPFQADSDGIVLGEGAVAIVLKQLRQATADGDRIRAIILGTGLTQSGGGDALTSPSAKAQARVMSAAISSAHLVPNQISAVEAHGVGSQAGDATETAALAMVFPAGGPSVAVDTVKPMLGHGLEVSGLSALSVAMLGMQREGGLPRLSKQAIFPGTALVPGAPGSAGPVLINGFSMNGTCAATVIAPAPIQSFVKSSKSVSIILSAALQADLESRLHSLKAWMLEHNPEPSEVNAVLAGDPHRRCQIVLRGESTTELLMSIDSALSGVKLENSSNEGIENKKILLPSRPLGYPFSRRRYWPDATSDVSLPIVRTDISVLSANTNSVTNKIPLEIIAECLGIAAELLDGKAIARELGVDSIMALEIKSRLATKASLALDISDLLGDKSLTTVLSSARSLENSVILMPDPANANAPFPLTDLQLAYLVGRSASVPLGGTGCHVYWEFVCDNPIDNTLLKNAWHQLVKIHDMLRAVFTEDGEQLVLAEVPMISIDHYDWSDMSRDLASQALEGIREQMAHEVFNPTRWPLFRIATSEGPDGQRIHFSIDLLIVDVLSLFRLLRQWGEIYFNPDDKLIPPMVSFRDYMAAFTRLRESNERNRALVYWEEFMAHAPRGPQLPRSRADADLSGARFKRRRTSISAEAWNRFQNQSRKIGSTPVSALIAALGATLARWSIDPHCTLNLTVYDRRPLHPDISKVVGDFTSTVLVPTGDDRVTGFAQSAALVSRLIAQHLDHTLVSGAEAVRRFSSGSTSALAYVFTSMLGYESVIGRDNRITKLGRLDWGVTQTPQVLLDVQVFEEDGELVATWDSVDAAYPDGLFDSVFAAFAATLHSLSKPKADWQASITVAIECSERNLINTINATAEPICDDLLHEPLLRQALAEPTRIAIMAPELNWTYGDLVTRAMAVAVCLPEMPADTLIGVALEKSPWQIAATLGVLIAGGAYLPLDPLLPAKRFQYLALKGEVKVILTTSSLVDSLVVPDDVKIISVDKLIPAPLPNCLPPRHRVTSDLAYVLFTSGSTGEPKGVMIEHRSALNTILDCNARFKLSKNDRILGLSSLSFDLSVYDIFGPTSLGATLVLSSPNSLRNPEVLIKQIHSCSVTVWNSVPMLFDMVLESRPKAELLSSIRLILLSGDWIPLSLPTLLRTIAPQAILVSLGGATEASIWSVSHIVRELINDWRSIPYGRPMHNQGVHVLDADMVPCAEGMEGDLYISGLGLARGYWRDPKLTSNAFINHPTTKDRLYCTGDRARWRIGGVIEFLGRHDGQVKIGGFRIELGEIESAALRCPNIRLAVALVETRKSAGSNRIILYAVPEAGMLIRPETLRTHLVDLLPDYMIPRSIKIEENLPLTDNGKIDRKTLMATCSYDNEEKQEEIECAAEPLSTDNLIIQISSIIANILGISKVPAQAAFFDLGADSMSAVLINRQLRSMLGLDTRITDLFEYPSVNLLANYLSKKSTSHNRTISHNNKFIEYKDSKESLESNNNSSISSSIASRRASIRQGFRQNFQIAQKNKINI